MKHVNRILKALGDFFFMDEKKNDERYLCQATDLVDLEFRMKQLQRRSNRNAFGMPVYVGH